jgi:serine/threonine-protein kinase
LSSAPEDNNDIGVKDGDVLAGKYRVDRVIGSGGMGVVVSATHVVLQDKVALKFLRPAFVSHAQTSERFMREARAAVRIKSPYVARVTDIGTLENGSPYMVMEYLEGKDLGQLIEEGPVDLELAVLLTLQTCEALAAAHALKIIHRDIKPANLFLTKGPDGEPVVKVLDFGISKVLDPNVMAKLTQTQTAMGSPLYMSPEQVRSARDVDSRADIWALGVSFYELVTGTLPFIADSMPQLCALVLEADPTPLRMSRPDLPEALDPIILKALAKNPADRFVDVAEMALALAEFGGADAKASAARCAKIVEVSTGEHKVRPSRTSISTTGPRQTNPEIGLQSTQKSIPPPDEVPTAAHSGDNLPRGTGTSFGRTGHPMQQEKSRGRGVVIGSVAAALALAVIVGFALRPKHDDAAAASQQTNNSTPQPQSQPAVSAPIPPLAPAADSQSAQVAATSTPAPTPDATASTSSKHHGKGTKTPPAASASAKPAASASAKPKNNVFDDRN